MATTDGPRRTIRIDPVDLLRDVRVDRVANERGTVHGTVRLTLNDDLTATVAPGAREAVLRYPAPPATDGVVLLPLDRSTLIAYAALLLAAAAELPEKEN